MYTGFTGDWALNEMQELLVPHMNKDYNVFVASPTASGKSTAIYMFGAKYILGERPKKRVLYIGTMRALVQEKADDLADPLHPWNAIDRVVISGDYKMDEAQAILIDKAQFICITPEALASRLRHPNSQRNLWLHDVGVIISDETHLITQEDRGTNLEAVFVEFSHLFPDVPFIGLSATVPNARELADWFTVLNGKHTQLIVSNYRPVPLEYHFIPYDPGDSRAESEDNRINIMTDLVTAAPTEQFMIGVWHKGFGDRIVHSLSEELGANVEFHNANKDKTVKKSIENNFKAGRNRVLVSTSTLFTGVNLPARNVVITAVEAAQKDIGAYELQQAAGRAGRPRYDTKGDAWFLIPDKRFNYHVKRIKEGELVVSHMAVQHWLAMHFLGAMYVGQVECEKTFTQWFLRTLAQHQQKRDDIDTLLEGVLDDMVKRGMVYHYESNGTFRLSRRGIICAQMYLNPYHFYDMIRNLQKYIGLTRPTDYDLAKAFGQCYSYGTMSITQNERAAMHSFVVNDLDIPQHFRKVTSVLLYRVQGSKNGNGGKVPGILSNVNWMLYDDLPRMHAAIMREHEECSRWDATADRIDLLFTRAIKSCTEDEATLAIAKFRPGERKKLNQLGIYTYADARNNAVLVSSILSTERMQELGLLRGDGSVAEKATAFQAGRGFRRKTS